MSVLIYDTSNLFFFFFIQLIRAGILPTHHTVQINKLINKMLAIMVQPTEFQCMKGFITETIFLTNFGRIVNDFRFSGWWFVKYKLKKRTVFRGGGEGRCRKFLLPNFLLNKINMCFQWRFFRGGIFILHLNYLFEHLTTSLFFVLRSIIICFMTSKNNICRANGDSFRE